MPRVENWVLDIINILKFPLTINNSGLNDSFPNFWHGGTCFEYICATGYENKKNSCDTFRLVTGSKN